MELRDYQIDALQRLRQSVKAGKRKILLSAPTGSGKGVLISKILERASERNNRCLFLVHKREIVHQVSAHLTDLPHGLIMAGETPDLARPIQLASKDTLTRRALDLGALDLIVVDEAHRATAKVYGRLLERWPDARVLGFTATPARNSGSGLGSYFDELIVVASVRELTEQGYLAPARYVAPPKMDMSKLKVTAGDYSGKSLAGAVSPILGDVLDTYTQFALGRRAVVFVPRVDHAILLADQFNGAGLPAKYICGTTPPENRRDYAERLRSGSLQIIVNVGVYVEGVDIPDVSCVVLATATKSLVKYLQMVGRGLRPGKPDCIVIDHGCNLYQHGRVDLEHQWALDSAVRLDQATPTKHTPKDIICEQCWTVYQGHFCPACGAEVKKTGKPLRTVAAQMGFVDAKPKKPPKPARTYLQTVWNTCVYTAVHRNLKIGAAAHMYRQKIGCWPKALTPMPKGEDWQLLAKDFLQAHKQGLYR